MRFEGRSGAKTNPNHGSQSVGNFNCLRTRIFTLFKLVFRS
jgi:hypothetical protein